MPESTDNNFTKLLLSELDDKLFRRLVLYTELKIRPLFWRSEQKVHIPGGLESADIVIMVIEKLLQGERHLNGNKTLLQGICSIIDSEVNHLVESKENQTTVRESISEMVNYKYLNTAHNDTNNITAIKQNDVFMEFMDSLKPYPLLFFIATSVIYRNIDSAKLLAKEADCTVTEIYSAKKRLKRKVQNFAQSHSLTHSDHEYPMPRRMAQIGGSGDA